MISFIIPTFNEAKAIEKTLKSISRYTGPREVIVSDDNSIDETMAIARRYTDKIIINQGKNRGIPANRNRGAQIAQGEYLVFIDSDMDIQNPDVFFKKAEMIFQRNNNIVAITVFIRVSPDLETLADKIIWTFFNYLDLILNNVFHIGGAAGKFQMIRAEAFRKVGGFNENLVTGEDPELFRRLAKIGRTHSEKTLTIYHSGRRAHAIGWPKLLWLWTRNTYSVIFFKKAVSKTWKDIR
jgi:glycosyltransferase involved in cell wall biosynthesis